MLYLLGQCQLPSAEVLTHLPIWKTPEPSPATRDLPGSHLQPCSFVIKTACSDWGFPRIFLSAGDVFGIFKYPGGGTAQCCCISSGGCWEGFPAFTNSLAGFDGMSCFQELHGTESLQYYRELHPVTLLHSPSRADWWPRCKKHKEPKCHEAHHTLQHDFQKIKSVPV